MESPYGQHHYDPVKSVIHISCNHRPAEPLSKTAGRGAMFPFYGLHHSHLIHGPNRVSATIVSRIWESTPHEAPCDRKFCKGARSPGPRVRLHRTPFFATLPPAVPPSPGDTAAQISASSKPNRTPVSRFRRILIGPSCYQFLPLQSSAVIEKHSCV